MLWRPEVRFLCETRQEEDLVMEPCTIRHRKLNPSPSRRHPTDWWVEVSCMSPQASSLWTAQASQRPYIRLRIRKCQLKLIVDFLPTIKSPEPRLLPLGMWRSLCSKKTKSKGKQHQQQRQQTQTTHLRKLVFDVVVIAQSYAAKLVFNLMSI